MSLVLLIGELFHGCQDTDDALGIRMESSSLYMTTFRALPPTSNYQPLHSLLPSPVFTWSTMGKHGWWHGDVAFGVEWTLIKGHPGESLSLRFATGKWKSFHPWPSIYLDRGVGNGGAKRVWIIRVLSG